MASDLESRVIELESQLLFMQRLVEELNTIVTKQQDDLEKLKKRFKEISGELAQSAVKVDPNEKPPHY